MSGYYFNLRNEIDEVLPNAIGTILDVGCGSGTTSKWLKQKYQCRAIGIEVDSKSAEIARASLDKVFEANIEEEASFYSDYKNQIDVILMLDVLEHIKDPWSYIEQIKPMLSEGGVVVASIPNVRNIKALGPL